MAMSTEYVKYLRKMFDSQEAFHGDIRYDTIRYDIRERERLEWGREVGENRRPNCSFSSHSCPQHKHTHTSIYRPIRIMYHFN